MGDQGTILVVDDEQSVRDSLQRILSGTGYTVQVSDNAAEALAYLGAALYDVVLTDFQMPGMDGLQLLAAIKQRSPDTPVVMISGYGSMELVVQALRGGVSDFVAKPFRPGELLSIVEREAARSRERRAPVGAPAALGLQLSTQQMDEIDLLLAEMRAETMARCVLLIEGNGHLIDAKGAIEGINVAALASLVAGDFAATAGIASLIGEDTAFRMNYHEGDRYSVYSAQVAPDVFLLVVFGQEIKLGSVLYNVRRGLPELHKVFELATAAPPPVERPAPAAPSAPAPIPPPVPTPPVEPEMPPGELFSFDEMVRSGLLGTDVLAALDAQFGSLWEGQ